jgi:hypothetical protein
MNKVLSKLAQARLTIQDKGLNKSGKNKHLNFNYYELGDILPTVNQVFKELGLLGQFCIKGEEAILNVYDVESGEVIEFSSPTAEAKLVKATPVQELGAVHTYLKRYLYLNALELVEPDVLDNTIGDDKTIDTKISDGQIELIKTFYDEETITNKILPYYKVKALENLTKEQANQVVKNAQAKK